MKFIFFQLVTFTLFGSFCCFPDCISPYLTCPVNASKFALPPISRINWEKCRDMCIIHTDCTSFTFYGPHGLPFKNMCFLFKEHCEDNEKIECNCGSGYQCDYCSIQGLAYSVDGDNFISMFTSISEGHCRDQCINTTSCMYYSFYNIDDALMPNTCILMSDSASPVSCTNCRTGPVTCNFSAQCKPNEAVIMLPKPSTHALIRENGTHLIETMGCSAEANVLLVGGGGTGGQDYSRRENMQGGGGSGYVDHVTIQIPYSGLFYFHIGRGGVGKRKDNSYHGYATTLNENGKRQASTGQPTSLYDEFGRVISKVQGGEAGFQTAGGNGYSGGGSADGQNGGMGGGDGGCSSRYKGGSGSNFRIDSVQGFFSHYRLESAKGNEGRSERYNIKYGGGGGGILIQEVKNDSDGVSVSSTTNYPFGQGGDGFEGNCVGNDGAVLIEIVENDQCGERS